VRFRAKAPLSDESPALTAVLQAQQKVILPNPWILAVDLLGFYLMAGGDHPVPTNTLASKSSTRLRVYGALAIEGAVQGLLPEHCGALATGGGERLVDRSLEPGDPTGAVAPGATGVTGGL
jgi:hypothetical protein